MELQVFERSVEKKREAKRVRRAGHVPAVVYLHTGATENVAIESNEFNAALRKVVPGRLPTTVFTLGNKKGKSSRVVVKDIQYKPTTYEVSHLDFEELAPNDFVNVKVPIECTGIIDCIGVKLGGVIRQVIRHLKVRCPTNQIPTHIEVDVKDLNLGQYKRLSDLQIPSSLKPLADLHEVAVVIVKR